MLFVFAYVDLLSLYRSDIRADLDAGEVSGFDVNQAFLMGTTAYVIVPSLMVFLTLILPPRRLVRRHDHRRRGRRVELLHPRQHHRSGPARGHRLLRLDLAASAADAGADRAVSRP
jgi:hypothetical protein